MTFSVAESGTTKSDEKSITLTLLLMSTVSTWNPAFSRAKLGGLINSADRLLWNTKFGLPCL